MEGYRVQRTYVSVGLGVGTLPSVSAWPSVECHSALFCCAPFPARSLEGRGSYLGLLFWYRKPRACFPVPGVLVSVLCPAVQDRELLFFSMDSSDPSPQLKIFHLRVPSLTG